MSATPKSVAEQTRTKQNKKPTSYITTGISFSVSSPLMRHSGSKRSEKQFSIFILIKVLESAVQVDSSQKHSMYIQSRS